MSPVLSVGRQLAPPTYGVGRLYELRSRQQIDQMTPSDVPQSTLGQAVQVMQVS